MNEEWDVTQVHICVNTFGSIVYIVNTRIWFTASHQFKGTRWMLTKKANNNLLVLQSKVIENKQSFQMLLTLLTISNL